MPEELVNNLRPWTAWRQSAASWAVSSSSAHKISTIGKGPRDQKKTIGY